MKEFIKSIVLGILLIFIGFTIYIAYKEGKLDKIISNSLYEYFKDTKKTHIGSKDFVLDDIKIKCRGIDAYVVEFNILFPDDKSNLNGLGAIVYKDKEKWTAKGTGSGISANEIKTYKFKCYKK